MISQSLGPTLSRMAKKAVLRTAQDIFALDKAFFLIEGQPSRFPLILVKPVNALPTLSTAKSLTDALLGSGGRGVPLQTWPVLVRA